MARFMHRIGGRLGSYATGRSGVASGIPPINDGVLIEDAKNVAFSMSAPCSITINYA